MFLNDSTLVIAAVSVVLPWSTWPIVPTFTCGFVLSNFAFAMFSASCAMEEVKSQISKLPYGLWPCFIFLHFDFCTLLFALPLPGLDSLAFHLRDDLFRDVLRNLFVVRKLHGVRCPALGL